MPAPYRNITPSRPAGLLAPFPFRRRVGARLGAADLHALRPHVVNLNMGRFAADAGWQTTPRDVDAIFDEHLPAALQAARARRRPLKLMFYAHGGLNAEADALEAARDRIGWWAANDIYPVYFIWHTGLCEILRQMLARRTGGGRALFADTIGDPLVEAFAHRVGGVQVWSAMKWSAQQSSAPNVEGGAAQAAGASPGGAWYVAHRLAAFCNAHPDVDVHAVGHSAGAIFHAHFIPCALAQGVPAFASLHLMAPAVRIDLFRQQLAPLAGNGVRALTMYTMRDSDETKDTCDLVYRKSLLYLIFRGLEPETGTPILGLERCIRADAGVAGLFGIGGDPGDGRAQVVWAGDGPAHGRSASTARAHGAFDDDAPTMGSIVRRILGLDDAAPIVELPMARHRTDPWHDVSAELAALTRAWTAAGQAPAAAPPALAPPSPHGASQ